MPMTGMPRSSARSITCPTFWPTTSEMVPPMKVKSCEKTKTGRPSISPEPVTTASEYLLLLGHAEIGGAVGHEAAHLVEGAAVEQQLYPLAGGQLAAGVLGGDALGGAGALAQRLHAVQFIVNSHIRLLLYKTFV